MKKIEVVAAIIQKSKEDRSVLVAQRGYGELAGLWEFPGGKIEPHETKKAALVREIKEELDLDIIVRDFLTTVEYDYPDFHLTMHCYICWSKGVAKNFEHSALKWCALNRLDDIKWCPADILIIPTLQSYLVK